MVEYLVRISAVNDQGELIAFTYGDWEYIRAPGHLPPLPGRRRQGDPHAPMPRGPVERSCPAAVALPAADEGPDPAVRAFAPPSAGSARRVYHQKGRIAAPPVETRDP